MYPLKAILYLCLALFIPGISILNSLDLVFVMGQLTPGWQVLEFFFPS